MHPAALPIDDLLRQCGMVRTRRGGPGGQHRNKVETAVVITHEPTGISAEASERRSQADNRRMAVWRLRLRLALEHRLPPSPGGASSLWRSRVRGNSLAIAADHDDYPALVAEALDRLCAADLAMAPVARESGITSSQLARLFAKNAAAWTLLNRLRAARGMPPLT
jgi:hypothetical protein